LRVKVHSGQAQPPRPAHQARPSRRRPQRAHLALQARRLEQRLGAGHRRRAGRAKALAQLLGVLRRRRKHDREQAQPLQQQHGERGRAAWCGTEREGKRSAKTSSGVGPRVSRATLSGAATPWSSPLASNAPLSAPPTAEHALQLGADALAADLLPQRRADLRRWGAGAQAGAPPRAPPPRSACNQGASAAPRLLVPTRSQLPHTAPCRWRRPPGFQTPAQSRSASQSAPRAARAAGLGGGAGRGWQGEAARPVHTSGMHPAAATARPSAPPLAPPLAPAPGLPAHRPGRSPTRAAACAAAPPAGQRGPCP
jgi:hypothetical protein